MYQWFTKMNNDHGYTLLEAVLHLSVLMLFAQVLLVTVSVVFRGKVTVTNPTETEWALFVYDVDSYITDVDDLHVQVNDNGIRFQKTGKEYNVEFMTLSFESKKIDRTRTDATECEVFDYKIGRTIIEIICRICKWIGKGAYFLCYI